MRRHGCSTYVLYLPSMFNMGLENYLHYETRKIEREPTYIELLARANAPLRNIWQ